jgi:hypothetical protein
MALEVRLKEDFSENKCRFGINLLYFLNLLINKEYSKLYLHRSL